MRITKAATFDAAHYLENKDADGGDHPYARMHGHSFRVEITVEGEPDPDKGWVADFADVADALEEVSKELDHRLLNDVDGLAAPTLENLCLWIAAQLTPRLPGLVEVKVERPSNGEACVYTLD
ncbi:MAG: 6-carboxytetrahydropterin synthase QueD [Pseudomonadota bacterium]